MRIILDLGAAHDLESQLDYLISHNAPQAAARLKARLDAFLESFLAVHPRTGKYISEKDIWETWVPGTRLVVWYRFNGNELQIIRVWHSAQDRAAP